MEKKIKIRSIDCDICNGIGLLELDNPQMCIHCSNINGSICYLCENKGGIVKIKECETCCGYGKKFYDIQTNKQVFLYSLTNYKLL